MAEELAMLSHDLSLYVLLISRGTKVGRDEQPELRHVEGEAGVANAADQVWWLEPDKEDPEKVEIRFLKSRQAYKGKCIIRLDGPRHRFEDWDENPLNSGQFST